MKIPRFLPLLLFLSASIHAVFAQSPSSVPYDGFERLLLAGLANDPRGKAIALAYGAALADAREAEAKRLLDAGLSASYSHALSETEFDSDYGPANAPGRADSKLSASSIGPLGSTIAAGLSYGLRHGDGDYADTLGADVSVSLPLLANGRLFDARLGAAARRVAVGSPIEAASAREKADRCAFVISVMDLILEYSEARAESRLSEREAEIAQRDLEIARVKYSSGVLPFKDLQEAENDAESKRLAAIAARSSFGNLSRGLSASTGIPTDELASIPISLPRPPAAYSAGARAGDCLSVSGAERELKDAEASRILSGAQSAPKLSLAGGYSWELRNTFPGSGDGDSRGPLDLKAGVSLDLGFAAAARRKEAADARARAAAKALDDARAQAASSLGELESRIESAKAQADYLATNAESAKARVAELEASVRAGTALPLDAERASLAYDRVQAKLETKRGEYLMALAELFRLTGKDGTVLLSDMAAAK